ncbi:MAG: hypothetical protein KZQ77_16750, partial [Candidatus Thiodiazotropha sp. (ex Notomyrtea botanica)]|nr:hypothetical protein [Candidatus Thiodiazotropha sp. (ex Notomyrtea botanica)]
DGEVEIVLYGETNNTRTVLIYDGSTLTQEWTSPPFTWSLELDEINMGNVDGDPALEIVTGMGHIIDGQTYNTRILKSDGFSGFTETVIVGDADNDGIDDIVHSTPDFVYVYDDTGRVKNRFDSSQMPQTYQGRFENVIIGDITGQGKNHIIVSVENTVNEIGFFLYNETNSTYEVDYRLNRISSYGMMNDLTLEDIDNDGSVELFWIAQGNYSGRGLVSASYQSGINSIEIEWYKNNPTQFDIYGFFTPSYVKSSTDNSIWFISNNSYQLDGDSTSDKGPRLIDLDLSTNKISVTNPLYTPSSPGMDTRCTYISIFKTHDMNSDTVADAVIPPCRLYYPAMTRDLQNNATILSSDLSVSSYGGAETEAMDIGDFGNDGTQEVAIVSQLRDLYVYDPQNNQLIWEHEFEYPANGVNVFINDLDKNGSKDLVVALEQKILTFDYNASDTSFSQNSELLLSDIFDVQLADLDGDNIDEVIVAHGTYLNQIISIYDNSFNLISTFPVDYPIASVHIEDLSSPRKNILVSGGDYATYDLGVLYINRLYAIDPFSGKQVWQSPNLLGNIPKNSL